MTNQPQPKPELQDGMMIDDKGRHVPIENIPHDRLLENQTVDKIFGYADDLSAQLTRFKGYTLDDIYTLIDILSEKYGIKKGGVKGNVEIKSFDGLRKVAISQADQHEFGPQLQTAKQIFDEVIKDKSDGVETAIITLVERAFEVGKTGRINREGLLKVRDLKIDHPKWPDFQQAVNDSIRTIASKTYVRIHSRPDTNSNWKQVSLNIATAE